MTDLEVRTDVTFNGVALSAAVPTGYVTQIKRGLLGDRRDVYTEVPGRAGSWMTPGAAGDRDITVSVHLLADTYAARRAAVNALAAWADSDTMAPMIVDDEPDRYWDAKLIGPADPAEWLLTATADLDFRTGPYAKALTASSESWSVPTGAHTFTVPDEVAAQPVIELTAGATINSFHLLGTGGGGTDLVWGAPPGSLASGAKITVNGICSMVTLGANADTNLTGYFNPANVSMGTVAGTFPVLKPGSNTITVQTLPGGAAASLVCRWRRQYRG